ncbi:hypothetical protein C8J57DRAFT_1467840 [Mycena rebaudengoi]|nr:hypothetical protein C8J57DRAFT_1467840 [Mycena rebaudengoi]
MYVDPARDATASLPPQGCPPRAALTSLHLPFISGSMGVASPYTFLLLPTTSLYLHSVSELRLHETCPPEFFDAFLRLISPTLECIPDGEPLPALPTLPILRSLKLGIQSWGASRIEGLIRNLRDAPPEVEILVLY